MTQEGGSINGALAASGKANHWTEMARKGLDVLLPPQCLGCNSLIATPGALCPECWNTAEFLGPPLCSACGLPFEFEPKGDALCGACIRHPPDFERARSAMIYNETSRRLILAFKHGDRTDAAPAYGAWLARAGKALIEDADMLAPVPLHWTRLFSRRFNQSALLAQNVGRICAAVVVTDLLLRRRRTPSQGRLSPAQRRRNLRGAFVLNPAHANKIAGRRVLLIDDVLTTGATVSACARTLLRAGAGAVDVLTMARVVRSG